MGNDASARGSSVENRVEDGHHGNIVQTGTLDSVNIVSQQQRSPQLPTVLASAALVLALGLAAVWGSGAFGGRSANEEPSGAGRQAAPSPPDTRRPGASPVPSAPPASAKPDADGKGREHDADEPSASSRPSGSPGPQSGSGRTFDGFKTADIGEQVAGDRAVTCGAYSLCAYRKPGHQERFDLAAPDSEPGRICYSLPAGAPGFVSLVNGRGYSYTVYDKPRCKGDHHLVGTGKGYQGDDWNGFAFVSYVKA